MEAKKLRLAKWKQTKQAAAPEPLRTADEAPGSASEAQAPPRPASSAVKLSFANLKSKRKQRKRVTLGEGVLDDEPQEAGSKRQKAAVSAGAAPTAQTKIAPEDTMPESVDSFLKSLEMQPSLVEPSYIAADENSSSEDEMVLDAVVKKPKTATAKLDTVVTDHSTEPFLKDLFVPTESSPASAEAFRRENKIQIDGIDLPPLNQWHAAGLPLPLMRAIESRGFEKPTPIQAQSLPVIMSGADLLGVAPTSSGKTMAFLVPLCRHVAANQVHHKRMSKGPYALVLAPTRELCLQIFREVEPLAKSLQLNALGCYGGTDISSQISELVNGRCDIMVATPGRLIDLLATNHGRILSLRGVTFLVIDETDRMFDLGFGPQVRTIVGAIRHDRQTVVFSATMSPGMESLVARILTRPSRITVGRQSLIPPQIAQEVLLVSDRKEKMTMLLNSLDVLHKEGLALVFVDTQEKADAITLQLMAKGLKCQALHGGMDQQDRATTIAEFREGLLPVLVATSIAARGLDVRQIKLVVNYDAASHLEDYVHRAGRTGRAGESGKCITFLEPGQARQAFDLAKLFAVPAEVQKLAEEYRQTTGGLEQRRFGFGGHGLANLEKKRDIKKTVEYDAYEQRDDSKEPEAEPASRDESKTVTPTPIIGREGQSFAARLPINDKPKEARIAVTSAVTQTRVSSEFRVSVTIRGTFHARPRKETSDDEKLHLYIEGDTHESVLGAFQALNDVLDSASMKQGGRYMVL